MSFTYVNIMSEQVWKYWDHKAKKPDWVDLPSNIDPAQMKANFARAKEAGFGIVKFYKVKGTDIPVGHEALVTEGIRNLPADFPVKDMDKLVLVNSNYPSKNQRISNSTSAGNSNPAYSDIPFD